jgi:hypothetical protein
MIAGRPESVARRIKGQREESPDSHRRYLARAGGERATRLVTPGGCVARSAKAKRDGRGHGKCHRKYTAGVIRALRQAHGKTEGSPLPVECIWQG